MQTVIHAMQLEAAFQWYHANANAESSANLATRERWFAAMKRINCTICERPLTPQPD